VLLRDNLGPLRFDTNKLSPPILTIIITNTTAPITDLCNGGFLWSCCVPRDIRRNQASIVDDAGKCFGATISFPSVERREVTRLWTSSSSNPSIKVARVSR